MCMQGGILLGPSCLGRNLRYWDALFPARQAQFLVMASLIGAAYFIFIITLKMDIAMTLRAAKSTWRIGVIPFLASFAVILILLRFHFDTQLFPHFKATSFGHVIAAMMSFSFFPVVSESLMEHNLITTELGQIALSSAILNDVTQWCLIASNRVVGTKTVKESIIVLISYSVFLFLCFFIIRPLMKLIVRRTPVGKPVKEIYIVFILLGVFVMAGISDIIGISIFMGPLFFGLVIPSGPPLGSILIEKSEAIMSRFILPFFFIFIGMNTDLSAIDNWKEFITFQCILFAGFLAKILACVLVSLSYNIKPRHGMVLGLMLNVKGITELIAFSRMLKSQASFSYFSIYTCTRV